MMGYSTSSSQILSRGFLLPGSSSSWHETPRNTALYHRKITLYGTSEIFYTPRRFLYWQRSVCDRVFDAKELAGLVCWS